MRREAARCWEPRRAGYNLALLAVALAWLGLTWPHFRPALVLPSLPPMAALAALANVCYAAAYLADLAIQRTSRRDRWPRWRWGLWCAGTLLAVGLECYWIADEIYPAVH